MREKGTGGSQSGDNGPSAFGRATRSVLWLVCAALLLPKRGVGEGLLIDSYPLFCLDWCSDRRHSHDFDYTCLIVHRGV